MEPQREPMNNSKDRSQKMFIPSRDQKDREAMNVVIVGHVDHGKSTLVGRLLADTGSLPEGKLEAVKAQCKRNAKPFEYAFLLDALKDEQAQGITIDTARSFFKSSNIFFCSLERFLGIVTFTLTYKLPFP